jgi:ankyrin repeat protein
MYATNLGDLDTVKVLVAAGAEIDGGRDNGASPLFWDSSEPVEVVVWLLEHRSEDGRPGLTARMLARQRGETEIVKMLLASGATR